MTFHFTRRLMATAAILAMPSFAWALDGQDLLKKINAAYGDGRVKLAAVSVDISGDNAVLKGATLAVSGPNASAIPVGDVRLSGVTANEDGSYEIERVDFQPLNMTQETSSIRADNLYMTGVSIPANTNGDTIASMMTYEKAHAGPMSITSEGKPVVSVASADVNTSVEDDGASLAFDSAVKGIKVDLSDVKDPKAQETIEKLDLKTLSGEVAMKGSWELQSGTIDIEDYTLNFDRVGKLSMAFSLSGYTLDLVKQFQETAKRMEEVNGDEQARQQAQQAAGIAMLGLIQQMSFLGADIRFDDAGITKRALDYAGAQQGVSGKDMTQMIKAMVPMMLAQAKLGAFQQELSAAVNAYLDNPKSLDISAEPENPVPFPMIAGAAMGAPETLPKLLGAKVTANEAE